MYEQQRWMLADFFDGTTETVVCVSKKNGKTTLLSAVALHHVLTTPDAECIIAAASRDQAQILLGQMQGFIRRSDGLRQLLQVKQREVVRRDGGGRARVIASDSDTADGVLPTLALVDELHRHKSAELYGVFRDGLGPRSGRMVTISTAGSDETSPLGRLREAAYALPGFRRDGTYRYARSPDAAFAWHEWALDVADDRSDMRLVMSANPAPWHTEDALRRRFESPSTTPAQWARFACGVWLTGDDTAIGPQDWQACAHPGVDVDGLGEVVIGVDLGWKYDTTALVTVATTDDGRIVVGPVVVLEPPRDGTMLSENRVIEALEDLAARLPVRCVALDPNAGGYQLAQRLEDELGVPFVEHSQKPSAMATAATKLLEAIRERRLMHPDDPVLNQHVLAAAGKQLPGGEQRFVKQPRSRRPIDALIALTMAVNVATAIDTSVVDGPLVEWV